MIYLPPSATLKLIGVSNAGQPNLEYITLFSTQTVNLAQYGIILGYKPGEIAQPLNDHFLWLSGITIDPNTWIFIFTGSGEPRFSTASNGQPAYILYWGKENVLFTDENFVPLLISIGTLDMGKNKIEQGILENKVQ